MTVYIEYVLIDNLVIDYILLKSAFALLGKKEKRGRLFLCAAISSGFALVSPIITLNGIISGAIKICFLLLMLSICFKFVSAKEYVFFIFVFLGLTFATGGAIIGIFSIFSIDYSGEISIAFMCLPVYFVVKVIKRLITSVVRRKIAIQETYKCRMILKDVVIEGTGFIDNGNAVYDDDSPVIFCQAALVKKFVSIKNISEIKYLRVSPLGGELVLPSFKIDRIEIYYGDEPNIFDNVTLCAVKNAGFGMQIILHPALRGNYETDKSIEKIS